MKLPAKLPLPRPFLKHFPKKVPWSWCLCVTILCVLALFLTGHSLFGLSKLISALMAILGVLMAPFLTALIFPLLTFITVTLIAPFIALVMGTLTALGAALTLLITPLLTALSGLWAWFLGTAVGQAIVAPLYTALAPIVLKIAPWLTTSKFAGKLFKHPRLQKAFIALFGLRAAKRKPRRSKA